MVGSKKLPIPTMLNNPPNHNTEDIRTADITLSTDDQPGINETRHRCPTPQELHDNIGGVVSYNSTELFGNQDLKSQATMKSILNQNEEAEVFPIYSFCRFCMSPVTEDHVEIFSKSFESNEIRNMCKVVLPNKVRLGDGRPSKLCRPCITKLKACNLFFEQLLYAENYYKTIIKYSLFIEDEDSSANESDVLAPEDTIPKNSLVLPINTYSSVQKGININRQAVNDDIEVICNNTALLPKYGANPLNCRSTTHQDKDDYGEKDYQHLIKHKLMNNSEIIVNRPSVSYKCFECSDIFPRYSVLVNHIKDRHNFKTNLLLNKSNDVVEDFGSSSEQQVQRKTDTSTSELEPMCNINTGITTVNLECRHCDITFDNTIDFKTHLKESHSFKCPHCARLFFNKDKLDKHILAKHDHNTKCNICGREFKTAAIRNKHEKCHDEKHGEICWICGAILKTKGTLLSHMKIHEDKEYPCEICSKVYKTKLALTAHKKNIHRPTVETNGKTFLCQFCPEIFDHPEALWQHTRVHKSKEVTKCEFCNKVFITLSRYNHHKKKRMLKGVCPSSAVSNKNSNECDVCKRVFVKRRNLNKHRKYHFCDGDAEVIQKLLTEPEIQKCDQCDKSCFSKVTLQYHKRVAHSVKFMPFNCSFCGKNLLTHNRLVIHERIHTGELPYQCRYCKKGFREPRALESHEMCHTNEKPHVCQICNKGFKTHRRLTVHTLRHKDATHLRPYLCTLCTRRFLNKGSLLSHINRFHSSQSKPGPVERKYQCEECGKIYATSQGYRNHKKKSHQANHIDVENNNEDNIKQATGAVEYVAVVQDSENITFVPSQGQRDENGLNEINKQTTSLEYLHDIHNDDNASDLGLQQGLAYLVASADSLKEVSTFWNISEKAIQ